MKLPYKNELYELRKWIDFTNANLQMQFLHTPQEIQRVHQWISTRYLIIWIYHFEFYEAQHRVKRRGAGLRT